MSPINSPRRDGWTPARQLAFLQALAATGNVRAAAGAAGMSRETAYRLRKRASAQLFARAWDRALALHRQAPRGRRSTRGAEVTVFVVERRSRSG